MIAPNFADGSTWRARKLAPITSLRQPRRICGLTPVFAARVILHRPWLASKPATGREPGGACERLRRSARLASPKEWLRGRDGGSPALGAASARSLSRRRVCLQYAAPLALPGRLTTTSGSRPNQHRHVLGHAGPITLAASLLGAWVWRIANGLLSVGESPPTGMIEAAVLACWTHTREWMASLGKFCLWTLRSSGRRLPPPPRCQPR